jgi:hypothetical protein
MSHTINTRITGLQFLETGSSRVTWCAGGCAGSLEFAFTEGSVGSFLSKIGVSVGSWARSGVSRLWSTSSSRSVLAREISGQTSGYGPILKPSSEYPFAF